jgi:ferredoxin
MPTTNTPDGLLRFRSAFPTKFAGKCAFCATATTPDIDWCVKDGKFIAVCATCALSVHEQCKAIVRTLGTLALTPEQQAVIAGIVTVDLSSLITGMATVQVAEQGVGELTAALAIARTFVPVSNVRPNRYDGTCALCKGAVPEQTGRIEKINNRWTTFHLDGQCPTAGVAFEVVGSAPVAVPEGRYALNTDDGVKFYRVEHGAKGGKWAGFVFVSAQASDDLHPIRNRTTRQSILDAIAADVEGATALYGRELGVCGRCGKTLTSEWREKGIGPVCSTKAW